MGFEPTRFSTQVLKTCSLTKLGHPCLCISMPLMGVEPMTYSLQSWCSTAELKRLAVDMGLEPTTFRVETECTIHCANRLK